MLVHLRNGEGLLLSKLSTNSSRTLKFYQVGLSQEDISDGLMWISKKRFVISKTILKECSLTFISLRSYSSYTVPIDVLCYYSIMNIDDSWHIRLSRRHQAFCTCVVTSLDPPLTFIKSGYLVLYHLSRFLIRSSPHRPMDHPRGKQKRQTNI